MVQPNVFPTYYLGSVTGDELNVATTGGTYVLTSGQVGIYPVAYDSVQGTAISTVTAPIPQVVIGSGNWRTSDGPNEYMKGMKQNSWTKPIPLRNVKRFQHVVAQQPQNQITAFGWDLSVTGSTAEVGPTFFCGQTYELKLEVLGEPALKAFNKYMYNNFMAWGGCCGTGCTTGCTSSYADAACIMLQWKDQMYTTPNWVPTDNWGGYIYPQVFINSSGTAVEVFSQLDYEQGRCAEDEVYVCDTTSPESVVAGLKITVAYTDTNFTNCTFSVTDSYDIFPAFVTGSLVFQNADPCAINTTINTSVPNMYTELQAPRQPKGVGNIVRKNLILEDKYQAYPWSDSNDVLGLRFREVEGSNWILDNTTNGGLYDSVVIEWYLPNQQNSSSNYDGSENIFILYVPTGTDVTPFTDVFEALLDEVGSGVTLTQG
jgi:hypothetical protein